MRLLSIFLFTLTLLNSSVIGQTESKNVNLAKRATNLACIIPGSGHIYNNKNKPEQTNSRVWWKLPIIYGGLGASGYFTYFNLNEFKLIRSERLSRQNNPPSYLLQYSDSQLKYLQEDYRRLRDISIISFFGVYLLQIIDANVEGHLFQFDTDDKLSLSFKPNVTGINNEISFNELSLKWKF
jgi:hypothetical protein